MACLPEGLGPLSAVTVKRPVGGRGGVRCTIVRWVRIRSTAERSRGPEGGRERRRARVWRRSRRCLTLSAAGTWRQSRCLKAAEARVGKGRLGSYGRVCAGARLETHHSSSRSTQRALASRALDAHPLGAFASRAAHDDLPASSETSLLGQSHSLVLTGCPRRVAKRPLLCKAPQRVAMGFGMNVLPA